MKTKTNTFIVVLGIILPYAIVQLIAMKLIWGRQVSWIEVIILVPIVTLIAVIAGFQLMKQAKGNKKE